MPPVPRIPFSKAIKAFELAGWKLDRVKGSHHTLIKPGMLPVTLPNHGKKELGLGLLKKQISNAGLSVEEFLELLERT